MGLALGVDQHCPPGWSGPGLPRGEQGKTTPRLESAEMGTPGDVEYLPKAP